MVDRSKIPDPEAKLKLAVARFLVKTETFASRRRRLTSRYRCSLLVRLAYWLHSIPIAVKGYIHDRVRQGHSAAVGPSQHFRPTIVFQEGGIDISTCEDGGQDTATKTAGAFCLSEPARQRTSVSSP